VEVSTSAIGGLTEVGFAAPGVLLVVSHQGRGLYNCATGERLARDKSEAPDWFDPGGPSSLGIGPYEGVWIAVAGLAGGSLRRDTDDGWSATAAKNAVALHSSDASQIIDETEEIQVFGFSEDGSTFVLGSSPTLRIFRRR
jgi:hypothetical protein